MILLPAESLDRKQNHTDSLYRNHCFVDGSLGRSLITVLHELCCDCTSRTLQRSIISEVQLQQSKCEVQLQQSP